MPVVTVLSRSVGDEASYTTQDVTLMPVSCSTLENAVEACLQASALIKAAVMDRVRSGGTDIFELNPSCAGIPRARTASLESAVLVRFCFVLYILLNEFNFVSNRLRIQRSIVCD
jgi:hypothetical protein